MSISNAQLLACTLIPLSCLGRECTLKATFVGNKIIKTKIKLILAYLYMKLRTQRNYLVPLNYSILFLCCEMVYAIAASQKANAL